MVTKDGGKRNIMCRTTG